MTRDKTLTQVTESLRAWIFFERKNEPDVNDLHKYKDSSASAYC